MMNNTTPNELYTNILAGELLRQHRRTAGLTGCELAARCGISQQQVSRYERGITQITVEAFLMFCAALKIEPGLFFQTLQQLSTTDNQLVKYMKK
ncbi:helix-turn-helix domain-containing protein [Morganella psychrotolerans]|uniref:helix-turn-helix domain-containing protein n=1 Tax=Morganella psychrotolerans TaxID=368603 RepID=UPI0039AEF763